ncbi:MAG TPA: transglutaminase-like domain-containing protein [Candidatus Krumholzibacteria bacterium]|nr:transglutaminase-like domain-containing protein [Candidatus Krumholzibacteria bacterium]
MKRLVCRVALASCLLFVAGVAAAAGGAETWYVVRIGGATVGTASESLVESPAGMVFRAHMNVRFTRLGTPLSMMVLTEEETGPAGQLIHARMESSLSNSSSTATLEGDSVRYESTMAGAVNRRIIAWREDAVTEAVASRRVREWVAGDEAETSMTVFDVADGGFRTQRYVRGETTGEGDARVTAVEEYDDGAETASSTIWFDSHADVVRTVVRQLGVEIVIERVPADSVDSIEIVPDFDIIRQSMVRCEGFPQPVRRVRDVTLHLDFAGALPTNPLNGPNQQEIARADHSIDLRLTRETSVPMREDRATLDKFLAADRFVQSDSPVLVAVADSIRTASNAQGWELARAVAGWVNRHITHKGMEHGYSSALDVFRSCAGDCTEHSLLTVAVLRAAGLPARPVVGLAYGEGERAFVGHMWTEVYVDGWRTLDALDLALDPIRLRVHAPESSESLGERDLLRAYGAVAGVRVRVTDYHLE